MKLQFNIINIEHFQSDFSILFFVYVRNNLERSFLGLTIESNVAYLDVLFFRIKV